jgi:hypothetical protein
MKEPKHVTRRAQNEKLGRLVVEPDVPIGLGPPV